MKSMNVRFLEAFVWVTKLGSFKAAAEKLHTTQAGVSSRISTLEEQLGVKLFEREHRAVTLTYQGSQMLPYAERMIELQARLVGAIGKSENLTGVLRIGVIETVVHTWLADLLTRFSSRYSKVTVEVVSETSFKLRDDLLRGVLDCTITAEEITPGFVDNRRLAEVDMRWVASEAIAKALPAGRLNFTDLAKHPLISFSRESSVYRNIVQQATGVELRVNYFSSLGAMIGLARSGFGIALVPAIVIGRELSRGELVLLDVEPEPAKLLLVASMRAEPASPLAEAFMALAHETCSDFMKSAEATTPPDPVNF